MLFYDAQDVIRRPQRAALLDKNLDGKQNIRTLSNSSNP